MSKLEKLINELCPNGVEYIKLKECTEMKRGTSATKNTLNAGNIPVISGGKEPAFYCDEYNRDGETITVAGSGAGAGYVQFWNEPIFVNDAFSIKGNTGVNTRYIYHYLLNIQEEIYATKKGGGVPHVHISSIENFWLPVPPLEVQCEIVHILDDFTSLSVELSAELLAELKARQKQYEYYRNELLKLDDAEYIKFGDIALIQRGASPRPITDYITNREDGVNWIKIGDVNPKSKYIESTKEKITPEGAKKSRIVKKGDFILSNSMSFGRPYILKIDGCIHDGWLSISNFDNYYISDFLYHLLNCNKIQYEFRKKASFGGAVQNLNADIVRNIEIPLVPLEKQRQIVEILNKFENFTNNISEGLSAEIKARQKQYEYYRDKLLTFKELEVNE